VINIGKTAFCNCTSLTELVIGNNVDVIGQQSFYGCTKLVKLTIADKVTEIGVEAFAQCKELTQIIFGKIISVIDDESFKGCNSLNHIEIYNNQILNYYTNSISHTNIKTLVLGGSISDPISTTIFSETSMLNKLSFLSSNIKIKDGEKPFEGLTKLKELTIVGNYFIDLFEQHFSNLPIETIYLDDSATCLIENNQNINPFASCPTITSFEVPEESVRYSTVDGVLYYINDKGMTTLLIFPPGRTGNFTVPDNVRIIATKAFYKCKLSEIVISKYVSYINSYAFLDATELTNVTFLGKSSPCIGSTDVFGGCSKLSTITVPYNYEGEDLAILKFQGYQNPKKANPMTKKLS